MTQIAKAEARPPVQDFEEGKSFPRGREGVWEGSRMRKGQTQTRSQLWSQPGAQEVGVLTALTDSVSRVTMMRVPFWLKGRGDCGKHSLLLGVCPASAAIMEEEAPLCVHLGLH